MDDLVGTAVKNDVKRLEEILTEENLTEYSAVRRLKRAMSYLDYNNASRLYGENGIKRFYDYALANPTEGPDGIENLDHDVINEKTRTFKKILWGAAGWLAYPAKIFSKVYDFVLRKTDSHLFSYAVAGFSLYETLYLSSTTGFTALASYEYGLPFISNLSTFVSATLPIALLFGAGEGLGCAGFLLGNVSVQRRLYNPSNISTEEIETDVRSLSIDFMDIWRKYDDLLSKDRGKAVGLQKLDAVYSMVTSNISDIDMPKKDFVAHEAAILPAIQMALGKKVYGRSIIHHCPSEIGGITLMIPSVIMGKFSRKHAYGPVFLNKKRANLMPNYDFALAHEFAHAAGAASEPLANVYALRALEEMDKEFPLNGYDLYVAINKLCFAAGALRERFNNESEFFVRLKELGAPKFLKQTFRRDFDGITAPTPPMSDLCQKTAESRFAGLYIVNSYIASKLVERGKIKLRSESRDSSALERRL